MNNAIFGCALLAAGLVGCEKQESSTTTAAVLETKSAECRFKLDGMVCQGCADAAGEALRDIDGVYEANVSYEEGGGTVRYDPSKTTPAKLMATLGTVEMNGKKMPFEPTLITEQDQKP